MKPARTTSLATILALALSAGPALGQSAEDLLAEAITLHADLPADSTDAQTLRAIRSLLDRIIDEHPASDLAFRLLVQEPIEGLDVAALDARLATLPATIVEAPPAPAVSEAWPDESAPSLAEQATGEAEGSDVDEETVADAGPEPAGSGQPAAGAAPPEGAGDGVPTATGVEALIAEADALYTAERMAEVQALLDRILEEYPASDEAISLLLGLPLGRIDPARVAEGVASGAPPAPPAPGGEGGLLGRLSACFAGVPALSQAGVVQAVTVEAQIGPGGEVQGLPVLTAPANVDAGVRQLFQRALGAIDDCAPYPEGGGALVLVASVDAVISATLAPAGTTTGVAAVPGLPAPPAVPPVWRAATEADERGLRLDRTAIRELQGRLSALGFDPRGVDGIIGRGTRSAISAWQGTRNIPATGFLDAQQMGALRAQSDGAYETWLRSNPATAPRATTGRSTTNPRGRYIDRNGCLREANGRIVPNFRRDCR